jgi:hypothetical protein
MAVHLVVLIVLALLTYRLGGDDSGVAIEGDWSSGREEAAFESVERSERRAQDDRESTDTPVEVEITQPADAASLAQSVSPRRASALPDQALTELQSGGSPQRSATTMYLGGGGMASRTPEGRVRYGQRYGATAESEAAVENALRWLAAHQRGDGSWSFDLQLAPCNGRCRHGKPAGENTPTPATAATGLALLAFLGAGYTPHTGPYRETVSKGLYYLRDAALETQHGYDWQQAGSMYGHGIALMALSEALGMTKLHGDYDTDLLHHVEQGSRFTTIAQHPGGSWGYTPGSPGDTTITGWQVLSLIGAKKAGVAMRSDTFSRAKAFLMSVRAEPDYAFGYRSAEPKPTTTAIALALLMYLGQRPGHSLFDQAIDEMAARGPTLTNIYHDYYATLALHHVRHRDWESWNEQLRDHLVRSQAKSGHEAGSWHFRDRWGDVGGRLYTTAMCTLTLEVYYRFLPLYEPPPEFPL